jgi:hypothetical protein
VKLKTFLEFINESSSLSEINSKLMDMVYNSRLYHLLEEPERKQISNAIFNLIQAYEKQVSDWDALYSEIDAQVNDNHLSSLTSVMNYAIKQASKQRILLKFDYFRSGKDPIQLVDLPLVAFEDWLNDRLDPRKTLRHRTVFLYLVERVIDTFKEVIEVMRKIKSYSNLTTDESNTLNRKLRFSMKYKYPLIQYLTSASGLPYPKSEKDLYDIVNKLAKSDPLN